MDLQKIRVRQDLERMVINYFIRKEISEEQSAKICDHIDNTISGGSLPQPYRHNSCMVIPFPTSYTGPKIIIETVKTEQHGKRHASLPLVSALCREADYLYKPFQ